MDPAEYVLNVPRHLCDIVGSSMSSGICSTLRNTSDEWIEKYKWLSSFKDTRLDGYYLIGDISTASCVLLGYVLLALFGPRLMRNRKPWDLKKFVLFYNLSLSISNLYFAVMTLYYAYKLNYSYVCRPIRFDVPLESDKDSIELLKVGYLAYLSRIFEFLETLIYILRKKESQLTFLHIYHHATVFSFCFLIMYLGPRGPGFQLVICNCSVHFVMYLYYGLASLGPQYRKYLWWKKYLTRIQMLQFIYMLLSIANHIYIDCYIPSWIKKTAAAYGLSLLILFANFYYRAYQLSNQRKGTKFVDNHDNIVGYGIVSDNSQEKQKKT